MRKVIFAVFFMTSVLALSVSGQLEKRSVSKEGGFTIVLPAGFDDLAFSKIASPGGSTTYNYDKSTDRGECAVTYFDLAENTLKTNSVSKILESGRDGAIQSGGGTLDTQENLTVDGYPALSFTLHESFNNTVVYARMVEIVANSKVYALLFVARDKAELAKPDVLRFFNSISFQK